MLPITHHHHHQQHVGIGTSRPSNMAETDLPAALPTPPPPTPPTTSSAKMATKLLFGNQTTTTTKQRHKQTLTVVFCVICGGVARGNNFGALSCMACAAFFRSSIAQNRKYVCRKENKCQIDKESRVCCRACRFTKCTRMGMRKEMVQSAQAQTTIRITIDLPHHLMVDDDENDEGSGDGADKAEKLALAKKRSGGQHRHWVSGEQQRKRARIEYLSGNAQLSRPQQEAKQTLDALLGMLERAGRIRESGTNLPDAYFDRFQSLEELMEADLHLLNNAHEFSLKGPSKWDKATFMERVEKHGIYAERPKHRVLDHFLIAEMAKTMPAFRQMEIHDKVTLFHYVDLPIMNMINAYYSIRHRSDTVMTPSGQTVISGYLAQRYRSDQRVAKMSEHLYCHSLEPYKQLDLDNEVFALLLAILCSHYATPNLSSHAQLLLYQQSVRYSQILLQRFQSRLGILPGANRYVDAIRLIGHAIQSIQFYRKFSTYMDVFHLKGTRDRVFPKALLSLYSSPPTKY